MSPEPRDSRWCSGWRPLPPAPAPSHPPTPTRRLTEAPDSHDVAPKDANHKVSPLIPHAQASGQLGPGACRGGEGSGGKRGREGRGGQGGPHGPHAGGRPGAPLTVLQVEGLHSVDEVRAGVEVVGPGLLQAPQAEDAASGHGAAREGPAAGQARVPGPGPRLQVKGLEGRHGELALAAPCDGVRPWEAPSPRPGRPCTTQRLGTTLRSEHRGVVFPAPAGPPAAEASLSRPPNSQG